MIYFRPSHTQDVLEFLLSYARHSILAKSTSLVTRRGPMQCTKLIRVDRDSIDESEWWKYKRTRLLLGLRFPFTAKVLSYNPTNELRIFSYYPLLHFWRNFDERMKFCQTATLWSSNCATSWNFKLRLSEKYYTNSHETNCSNSPIGTTFRRGIIHICKLFHCKAYFDKPQTATLNYIFN